MKNIIYFLLLLLASSCSDRLEAQVPASKIATGVNINAQRTIVSAEDGPAISVANGTAFGSIGFPAGATTLLNNGDVSSYAVTWSSTGYSSTDAATYTIFGDYTSLPATVTNPFLVRPAISVTVQPGLTVVTVTTTGTSTFTVPSGVTSVFVRAIGAGGSGGSLGTAGKASGGGGAAYAEGTVSVTPADVIDYGVAIQNIASLPTGSDINGVDGNPTYFGPSGSPYVQAVGGKGGPANGLTVGLGGLGINCIGDLARNGGKGSVPATSRSGGGGGAAGLTDVGADAIVVSGTSVTGGIGNSPGGNGGNGSSGTAGAGLVYGGGGGGARNTGVSNTRGGTGEQGWLQYEYYGSSTPPPSAGDAYVVHIAGQSNCISPGNGSPGAPYTGALNTKMWISSATGFNALEYGVNNNANSGGSATAIGPELGIANAIGALATNSTYISKKAQSGTSMANQWNVDVNAVGRSSTLQFYTAVNYLQAQGKTIKALWWVFRQGEADQGVTNAYTTGSYNYGTGAPSAGTGANGDMYIDKTNNLFYGIKGTYGTTGWGTGFQLFDLSGAGTPSSGTGIVSNTYYDTTNDLFYVKTGTSTWTSCTVKDVVVKASYVRNEYKLINYVIDQLNSHSINTVTIPFKVIDCLIDNPQTVDTTYTAFVNYAKTKVAVDYETDNPTYATKAIPFSTVSVSDQSTIDGVHLNTSGEVVMGARAAAVMTVP